MSKVYRVSRTVARHDLQCSHCRGVIKKNTCVARIFNLEAHGRTECEAAIVDRYQKIVEKQREARRKVQA